VNGRAHLTTAHDVLSLWDGELRQPKLAIGIDVEEAFIHCAKAFRRGRVWDTEAWDEIDAAGTPDGVDMIRSHLGVDADPTELREQFSAGYEADLAEDLP
jgi:hypothetical protein